MHNISPRLQSPAPRRTRRIAGSHTKTTRRQPVGSLQSSSILQPGRLPRVQLILPSNRVIISHRGTQPLSTDSRDTEGCTLITLVPFRSSLPSTPPAPARVLDRGTCQMAISPNSRVPFVRQIPEGPLKMYGSRSYVPLLDRQ